MRHLKMFYDLSQFGARHCGSSSVLSDEETKDSDLDFYITQSQQVEFEKKFGSKFELVEFNKYVDEHTVAIYINKDCTEDPTSRIEVTVKKDQYAAQLEMMWALFRTDIGQELFRTKFWKRGGSDKDMIKQRIEYLIKALT